MTPEQKQAIANAVDRDLDEIPEPDFVEEQKEFLRNVMSPIGRGHYGSDQILARGFLMLSQLLEENQQVLERIYSATTKRLDR